jgi:hypothetical protein
MADIFISYANEDRTAAQQVANHLTAQGWSVWWDRDLTPGLEYAREIEEVLGVARCVVVIWSTNSTESRWVQDEAQEGLDRGILVPIRIDQAQIPLGFRGVQTADLSDWHGELNNQQLKRFLAAVEAQLNPGKVHVADSRSPQSGGLRRSRAGHRAALAALVVVVFVAGISAYAALRNGGDEPTALTATEDTESSVGTSTSEDPSGADTPPTPDNGKGSTDPEVEEATWGTMSWHPIENSHQLNPWCPAGSFLVAFDIDEVPSWDPQDSPGMARAYCATLAAASSSAWEDSFSVAVGAVNSHNRQAEWCPQGTYLVGLDQDRTDNEGVVYGDGDAPIIGTALCARPSGSPYSSSELGWHDVGFAESTTPSGPWCPDGAFMTRLDLDGGADGYAYPIVGSAECGRPTQ